MAKNTHRNDLGNWIATNPSVLFLSLGHVGWIFGPILYFPTWMVDFYGKLVGKYTIHLDSFKVTFFTDWTALHHLFSPRFGRIRCGFCLKHLKQIQVVGGCFLEMLTPPQFYISPENRSRGGRWPRGFMHIKSEFHGVLQASGSQKVARSFLFLLLQLGLAFCASWPSFIWKFASAGKWYRHM